MAVMEAANYCLPGADFGYDLPNISLRKIINHIWKESIGLTDSSRTVVEPVL